MSLQEIKEGSLKELWKVSLPLMISFLSTMSMLFFDRLFLAHYSPHTLGAVASAGTLAWALILGWSTIANLAEVFVAQYNGAKKFKYIGEPVWQMIWLGMFSTVFFILMGAFGSTMIYSPQDQAYELEYFRWMMYSSPFFVFTAGLSAFYIGQGKTHIIKWLALIANLVNIILDPILIFGVKGYVPSMGIQGAAIATGIGMLVETVILVFMLLSYRNREEYGTGKWAFKPLLFWRVLRIGIPPAVFVTLELIGWAIFYTLMTKMSPTHILVSSVCQSILMLFLFFGLGLEKGMAAVAGNLIGGKNLQQISVLIKSGIKLTVLFSLCILPFFVIYPDPLINWFFNNPVALENQTVASALAQNMEILQAKSFIKMGLITVFIYIFFENFRWMVNGILTAAGDTFFLMIVGSFSVWVFLIAPTYFFIVKTNQSATTALFVWVLYSLASALLTFWRYYSGKWKHKRLMEENESLAESLET